jgi:thiol-disulfide isomerase/thioredoxin
MSRPAPKLNSNVSRQPSMRRLALTLTTIVICAATIATAGIASQTRSGTTSSRLAQAPNSAAAQSLTLIDLAGYNKLLADHRGKPLLVTFWATWCEPCRDEYPLVNQIAKDYAAKGLVVLGVDMDDDSAATLIQHFLTRNKPIFPNVRKKMGHEDEFVRGVDPQWKDEMPANFFYAADGRLLGFMIGGHPREDFEKIINTILPPGSGSSSHP